MAHNYRYYKRATTKGEEPFIKVQAFLPNSLYLLLKVKADQLQLPVSRLLSIAVDNELDSETPFNYPLTMPETEYVEFAYNDEASKLMKFIERFKSGIGLDSLMLARRDIGISKRSLFMLAYRELKEVGLIEEYHPTRTVFHYAPEYMYVRAKQLQNFKTRYKKPEKTGAMSDDE